MDHLNQTGLSDKVDNASRKQLKPIKKYLGGHGSVFWVSSANFFFQNSGGAGLKMGSNQSLIYIFYENCEKLPILMVQTV